MGEGGGKRWLVFGVILGWNDDEREEEEEEEEMKSDSRREKWGS